MSLLGYLSILLPMVLYTGARFMKSMFQPEMSILAISTLAAAILLLGLWFVTNRAFDSKNAETGPEAAAAETQAFAGDSQTPPAADAPTDETGRAVPTPTGEAPNVNAPTVPSN